MQGCSPEPPGPLPTHLHTVCLTYSECLPTLLNPLDERACFSQVVKAWDQLELDIGDPAVRAQPLKAAYPDSDSNYQFSAH